MKVLFKINHYYLVILYKKLKIKKQICYYKDCIEN